MSETILLTRHDKGSWTAVCQEYPEYSTHGRTSMEALQRYNALLWRKHHEKQATLDRNLDRLRDAVRREAGIPSWALGFPSWLLWKKQERQTIRERMDVILADVCREREGQGLSYDQLTDEILERFAQG